ncbi:hypothetical protein BDW22DRAFT_1485428 [Trametopsis cervina]|nr:hypothetical protein BDW22DRAFT_1485428 [Trametopsis cervina]
MIEMDVDSFIPSRCAVTYPATHHGLEAGRKAVMADVGGHIPQVPLNYFHDNLLPPLPPGVDVERVKQELKKKTPAPISGNRWTSFKYDPSHEKNDDKSENLVFAPFGVIAKAVARAAMVVIRKKGLKMQQTAAFYCNPNHTPSSTNRTNTSRPDGYAVLKQPSEVRRQEIHWDNIVIPGEKKKHSSVKDINDNNVKIIWSLNHCMRETVQRRFVFGYTIEDASMRLWFCSRADFFVSEQFNFITDHDKLIHFFLSVMFASRSQLGYDPTITPSVALGNEKKKMYDITVRWIDSDQQVCKTTYRTLDPLANVAAEAAQGRGTRVWKGRQVDREGNVTGNIVVVKDCWIDDDRTREGDILAAIEKAAQASDNPLHKERFDRHFLHVVCHGDVYIDGEKDNTLALMRKSAPLPSSLPPYELKRLEAAVAVANPPVGSVQGDLDVSKKKAMVEHGAKTRYRIVFQECGKTIDKLTSAMKICKALHEANTGLSTLHELGWIHRDISAGNVLVMDDGVVKIADLEYSKRHDDDAPIHRGRTGTYHFVPIEVQLQAYLFGPDLDDNPDEDGDEEQEQEQEQAEAEDEEDEDVGNISYEGGDRNDTNDDNNTSRHSIPVQPVAIFKSNALHDLESLWWLSLYLTLSRRVISKHAITRDDAASVWVNDVLTHAENRIVALRSLAGIFKSKTQGVHNSLQFIAVELNAIRSSLVTAYRETESGLLTTGVDTTATLPALHSKMARRYSAMRQAFTKGKGKVKDFELSSLSLEFVDPRPKTPPPSPPYSLDAKLDFLQTRKRTRDDVIEGMIEGMRSLKPPSKVGHGGDDDESIPTDPGTVGEASLHGASSSARSTRPIALRRSSRISLRDEAGSDED